VIDVFCRLSAKTREKIMASVEILLRSLTAPRQRFGNFSEKVVHQIWAPAVANVTDGLLDLHDT
jgi:hypothetical protein